MTISLQAKDTTSCTFIVLDPNLVALIFRASIQSINIKDNNKRALMKIK